MTMIHFIHADGTRQTIDAADGLPLMRAARNAGVPGIIGECGGSATCLTCHCFVDEAQFAQLEPPDAHEAAMLAVILGSRANSRLSCQIKVTAICEGLTVEIPPTQG